MCPLLVLPLPSTVVMPTDRYLRAPDNAHASRKKPSRTAGGGGVKLWPLSFDVKMWRIGRSATRTPSLGPPERQAGHCPSIAQIKLRGVTTALHTEPGLN
jgi:hypothetical protein